MRDLISDLTSKISDRDRKILAVLFAGLIIFAFYHAIFKSYLPTYNELVNNRKHLETEVLDMQAMIASNKNLDKQIIEKRSLIEGIVDNFDWQVAKGDPILKLGDRTAVLSEKFELTSLVQGNQNRMDSIVHVPFELSARGSTGNIQDYLAYIENIDKALNLKQMLIEYELNYKSDTDEFNDIINLDLYLDSFGALDANQTKQQLASIIGRDDIFAPTIKFERPVQLEPEPDTSQPELEVEDEEEDKKIIRLPRYTFPSRQELGK